MDAPAFGYCKIILLSRNHNEQIEDMNDKQLERVFKEYLAVFRNLDKKSGISYVVQFEISGAGGRTAYLLQTGQDVNLVDGTHPNADVTITASTADWLSLLNGKGVLGRFEFDKRASSDPAGVNHRLQVEGAGVNRQDCAQPSEVGWFSLPTRGFPQLGRPIAVGATDSIRRWKPRKALRSPTGRTRTPASASSDSSGNTSIFPE